MDGFQTLLDTTDALVRSADADGRRGVAATLVPLAALALQHADAIAGLPDLLARHGWDGMAFTGALDLQALQRDLWGLYARLRNSAAEPRALQGPRAWDARRPLQSLIASVRHLRDEARRGAATGYLLNHLTHDTMVAIIDIGRAGLDAERLKLTLRRWGWDRSSYAWHEVPDLDGLLRELDPATERQHKELQKM